MGRAWSYIEPIQSGSLPMLAVAYGQHLQVGQRVRRTLLMSGCRIALARPDLSNSMDSPYLDQSAERHHSPIGRIPKYDPRRNPASTTGGLKRYFDNLPVHATSVHIWWRGRCRSRYSRSARNVMTWPTANPRLFYGRASGCVWRSCRIGAKLPKLNGVALINREQKKSPAEKRQLRSVECKPRAGLRVWRRTLSTT